MTPLPTGSGGVAARGLCRARGREPLDLPWPEVLPARVRSHSPRLTGHLPPGLPRTHISRCGSQRPGPRPSGGMSQVANPLSLRRDLHLCLGPPRLLLSPQWLVGPPSLGNEKQNLSLTGSGTELPRSQQKARGTGRDQNQVFLFIVWKVHLLVNKITPQCEPHLWPLQLAPRNDALSHE